MEACNFNKNVIFSKGWVKYFPLITNDFLQPGEKK
jgi:hypothetical protein